MIEKAVHRTVNRLIQDVWTRELSEILLISLCTGGEMAALCLKKLGFFFFSVFDAVKLETVLQKFNFNKTFAYFVFLADGHTVYFT